MMDEGWLHNHIALVYSSPNLKKKTTRELVKNNQRCSLSITSKDKSFLLYKFSKSLIFDLRGSSLFDQNATFVFPFMFLNLGKT